MSEPHGAAGAPAPLAPGPARSAAGLWARLGIWVGVGVVLALVALSYLDPHLMLDMADRLWSCF
jgi:hypothetical protein